jgi:cystathionine beta-lyase
VIRHNNRNIVENELCLRNGTYEIDFEDFEAKIQKHHVKLFLLCSPQNPVGRVWTRQELQRMGDICKRHHVIVVSDEIHCDFTSGAFPHTIFLQACPALAEQSVVCTAPSKTFNLAGLQVSNIWIAGAELRRKFQKEMRSCGYSQLNTLGLVAAQAAYESGENWYLQCKAYLRENLDFLRQFLQENLPSLKLIEPQGTYFAWLDCSGLGLHPSDLNDLIANKAKLWLDAGHIFGKNSGQFQRIVLACPRQTLQQALQQLAEAISSSKQSKQN